MSQILIFLIKNIFEDEKHFLYINDEKDSDITYNVGECKNYKLTDSAKSNGIECGYFRMNITIDTRETISSTTCNLFNLKAI